jgi:hypothetical protein
MDVVRFILFYVLLPLWLVAGFADYFCHRKSRIEETSGVKESAFHLAGLIEMGVPLLAILFLQVNALIVLIVIFGVLLHEATIVWDVRYANSTRFISPGEQQLHGVLELVPWFVLALLLALHWEELSTSPTLPNWSLVRKGIPIDVGYVTTLLTGSAVFGLIPYCEEILRCLVKARQRTSG